MTRQSTVTATALRAGAAETPIVRVAAAIGTAVRAFGEVKTELPVQLT